MQCALASIAAPCCLEEPGKDVQDDLPPPVDSAVSDTVPGAPLGREPQAAVIPFGQRFPSTGLGRHASERPQVLPPVPPVEGAAVEHPPVPRSWSQRSLSLGLLPIFSDDNSIVGFITPEISTISTAPTTHGPCPTTPTGEDQARVASLHTGPSVTSADTFSLTGIRPLASRIRVAEEQPGRPNAVEASALNLVSFQGDEHLLRGSVLNKVLRRGGRVLESSLGSAKTYALSEEVAGIDAFISHNWSVPKHKKFLALATHFNLRVASLFSLCMMILALVLTIQGYLPIWDSNSGAAPRGVACKLVGTPAFLLALLFYRDLEHALLCRRGPLVFLDKTCIHQEDQELQRRSIERLGAFLCQSSSMVIVYTDVYLQKLWTVYEVAGFLAVNGPDRMEVVPTIVPQVVIFGLVLTFCTINVSMVLEVKLNMDRALDYASILTAAFLALALRKWARKRALIHQRVASFDVRKCVCTIEADRDVVYRNIAVLMKAIRLVHNADSEKRALAAFNKLVRERLSHVFAKSVGRLGMRYRHILVITASMAVPYPLDNFAGRSSGIQFSDAWPAVLWWTVGCTCIIPLMLAGWSVLAGCFLHWTGVREKLYALSLSAVGCFSVSTWAYLSDTLLFLSRNGSTEPVRQAGLALLLAMDSLAALATLAVFWRPDVTFKVLGWAASRVGLRGQGGRGSREREERRASRAGAGASSSSSLYLSSASTSSAFPMEEGEAKGP